MTYSVGELILIACSYLLFLFLVAWITERGWLPARLVRHPMVYVFSLGVYASAWAIYGTVGYAYQYGYNFLSFFLGISGVFLLAPILLAPILRLTTTYQLSSLADLFAFRYRSRLAGMLTTLMMLAGMLPLLALQLKAVAESIQVLSGAENARTLAFWFCLLMVLFAILFGARHTTAREKHEGLVIAIATESLIKLLAFVGVALFGLYGVFDGPGSMGNWLEDHPEMLSRLYYPLQDGSWHSMIMAFFVSAVVMPHMFYMAFTENLNPRALITASWALPLMFLVMALCIPVILWSAAASNAPTPPDYYSLGIGMVTGGGGALLGYLAGLAGASGMLIVATLALSGMCLNHLVLPASPLHQGTNLYRNLLWTRRVLIAAILALAYLFYRMIGTEHSLVELGVLSFVATLQFVPGLIGALFWPSGNRNGLFAGMLVGFVLWLLALMIPITWPQWRFLPLMDLIGIRFQTGASQWQHVAIVSVTVNALVYAIVSIVTPMSRSERNAAEACAVDSLRRPYRWSLQAQSVEDFINALAQPLGPVTARREVDMALRDLRLDHRETRPYALRRLRDQLETNLSGLLGPSVAHQLVDDHLPYRPEEEQQSSEDIRFIESRLEQYRDRLSGLAAELDSLRRFHRQTLLELPMGVISLGADNEVIGWNLAIEALTGISAEDTIGSRLDTLPSPWGELFSRFSQQDDAHLPQHSVEVDGQSRWLSLHKSEIAASTGEQAGGQVLVIEDVTELRHMEAHLAHNERLASIGRLAAGVAHEIGNPVTAIACLTQNLDGEQDEQELQTASRQIMEQTRRITRIVESLVTFSHSGGLSQALHSPVNVRDTVAEAISLLQLDPDHRQQPFDNDCLAEHWVQGDAQRLLQVFINLLGNAADASEQQQPVRISSDRHERGIDIRVEDQGHGIPEELRDALFEPFVTSKAPGRGTGLGLALVYSIIEDHRGSILVESPIHDNHGTRFVITLPIADVHTPAQEITP
ncbi:sensory box histidine kinase [Alcanivorax hongdengensis A-11-3]|uniref:histidine kinase n=1 Tax=Alcanivorax hongdengensis A-11-3 TaxID=1177179 RepID=L0WGS0_9GAMM|nr:sensor histidine kinase [Alcanivorax hongdengensis]EKF75342.1 sensory box histidine kinase [Alcanivorax hongdengensis A-11-3]